MPDNLTAALDQIRARKTSVNYKLTTGDDWRLHQALIDSTSDVPRLLAALDAVLALHQPGPFSLRGALCREHDSYRVFSITSDEADRVAACPDCIAAVKRMCTCRGAEWPCADHEAISRALLGEDADDRTG